MRMINAADQIPQTYCCRGGTDGAEKRVHMIVSAINMIVILGSLFLASSLYPSIGRHSYYFLLPVLPATIVFMVFSAAWVPSFFPRGPSFVSYIPPSVPVQIPRHTHAHHSTPKATPILHPRVIHPPVRSTPPATPVVNRPRPPPIFHPSVK